jgi:hypothetical protein
MTVAVAACTLDSQKRPVFSGPSGLGLSLDVTATPDVLPQDGVSQSVIRVAAIDGASQPVVGLAVLTEVRFQVSAVPGQGCPGGLTLVPPATCLGLAGTTMTTGGDGTATALWAAPGFLGTEVVATVRVTPVGSNYANTQPRTAQILLSVF